MQVDISLMSVAGENEVLCDGERRRGSLVVRPLHVRVAFRSEFDECIGDSALFRLEEASDATPMALQSCRRARIGSILEARRAGANAARSDTASKSETVLTTVSASERPTP